MYSVDIEMRKPKPAPSDTAYRRLFWLVTPKTLMQGLCVPRSNLYNWHKSGRISPEYVIPLEKLLFDLMSGNPIKQAADQRIYDFVPVLHLADYLDCKPSEVKRWYEKRQIPADMRQRLLQLIQHDFDRFALRPDIYSHETQYPFGKTISNR